MAVPVWKTYGQFDKITVQSLCKRHMPPAQTASQGDRGVVYAAEGERFVNMAVQSARSLKQHNPGLSVTLFTNGPLPEGADCFDQVLPHPSAHGNYGDKLYPIAHTPYRDTLFIDADTYVCANIEDLFAVLDKYDIASTHDYYLHTDETGTVPQPFNEPNNGIILYRLNDAVKQLLAVWQEEYEKDKARLRRFNTQGSFNRAVWLTGARYYNLPQVYNFRCCFPCAAPKDGDIRIIHWDAASAETAAVLNASREQRVVLPSLDAFNEQSLVFITPFSRKVFKYLLIPQVKALLTLRKWLKGGKA